ncbi:Dyp-type peroxidase [Leucobacter viscericola]|uniref:Dyp-type peroxidase n=1 Tax=Leucobacter viscericola TaxID=2714935 RepID=A0A6G7XDF7_9MICO|nr:Dyp-type peroxidase [Leucobacter viscericola]QIK62401.1 Dyp-type peroxidase [Leucobacter viscericola]
MTNTADTNVEAVHKAAGAKPGSRRFDRRALLTGGAAGVGIGAVLGLGAALGVPALQGAGEDPAAASTDDGFGAESISCHGTHQAGIVTPPAAHVRYVAYTLLPETDKAALQRMFRIITGDVEGLTSGAAPLADSEPELAARPSALTITVGVGPALVDRVGAGRKPEWLAPLPSFERDKLSEIHGGGDLLVLLQADDPLAIAHAARMIDRDIRSFVKPHWTQQGFRQTRGAEKPGTTMRNLMGQVDGTVNPSPKEKDFSSVIWAESTGSDAWLAGGSALVVRRIRMELDTWEMVDRPGREQTIGRTLSDGAPLTGGSEHTAIDFDAKDSKGLPVIPSFAHTRRAHSTDPSERIFRRGANYDEGGESGLIFACYQQDPLRQFVPIQRRLDELDLLNEWVTHVGSAVFAILPGFKQGEQLGASLLAS